MAGFQKSVKETLHKSRRSCLIATDEVKSDLSSNTR